MREAVGIFDDPVKLDAAIAELEITAFPRHEISVLGSGDKVETRYGTPEIRTEWLEDSADAPRSISIRPEEKVIGAAALVGCFAYFAGCVAALAAKSASGIVFLASITGGSLVGAMLGALIALTVSRRLKSELGKQLQRGGLLLWVQTSGRKKEKLAKDILRKHGAREVHIHTIA